MPFILIAALALWWFFGDPGTTVADWLYPDEAAPWETVDAFYYPNRQDLTKHEEFKGLDSVTGCRSMVQNMALRHNDQLITKGDYECGVGQLKGDFAGLNVYRLTVK